MKQLSRIHCLIPAVLLIAAPFFFHGCTPEKAQALLTTAKAFQAKAKKALDAYDALIRAALYKPPLSEQEAVKDILNRSEQYLKADKQLEFDKITLGMKDLFTNAKTELTAHVQEQKMLYDAFVDSLINLPRASYLAASHVKCTQELVRRLVISIADYRKAIEKHSIDLIVPEEDAVADLEAVMASGTAVEKQNAARQIYTVFNQKAALNKNVINQATIAAATGLKLIKAIETYDTLAVGDILNILQQILSAAGTLNGINTKVALSKLDTFAEQAKGDDHWQQILALPFYEDTTPCSENKK